MTIIIVISNYSCCHGYHTQVKGYMIVMSHDDIDDEDEHLLHTQLHHTCHMLLHMTGLETGHSKDIHGEVCTQYYDNVKGRGHHMSLCNSINDIGYIYIYITCSSVQVNT